MVAAPALAGIVGLGAVGGILANIALTPLTAGASLLQSYWYGSGLILGERMMYTVHWEKIKGRLDKGEDFLQVLDKIMNDDITAIANLSFKAMDETGKLYLEKAGTGLAQFVENLLSAILLANPTGLLPGGDTEPPPTGTETETGISLTIEQIKAMSRTTLLFETQPNQITKYTEATQAHMLTELASRKIETEVSDDIRENLKRTSDQDQASYLVYLTTTTFEMWRDAIFATSPFRSEITSNVSSVVPIIKKRDSATWENQLALHRRALSKRQGELQNYLGGVTNPQPSAIKVLQFNVNLGHTIIWLHQLIYSL